MATTSVNRVRMPPAYQMVDGEYVYECTRCGHWGHYHSEGECGQEVCATGEYCRRCGGFCDDPMHESGWCRCPAYVEPQEEDFS